MTSIELQTAFDRFKNVAPLAFCFWYFLLQGSSQYSRFQTSSEMNAMERQIMGLLLAAMVIKYFRSQSLEAFFSILFLYGKTAVAVLAFMIDIRIFAYYIILYLMVFMMFPQPQYKGPDRIERLTPAGLRQCIKQSKSSGITWIVEFFAAWSPASVHLEPVFADISLRYATDCLRFAKVDLSRWPGIGKDYNIDVSGGSPQVPTFILFDNGVEAARIPHVYPDGSIAKGKYRKVHYPAFKPFLRDPWSSQADLIRGLELDTRHAKSLGKKENKKER